MSRLGLSLGVTLSIFTITQKRLIGFCGNTELTRMKLTEFWNREEGHCPAGMVRRRRRINESKRRHEARRYTRRLHDAIFRYSDFIRRVSPQTVNIAPDGIGRFCIPSAGEFEHLFPNSPETGIVFIDSSFLAVKEIFRYDYTEADDEPRIIRSEFSFHYQSPARQFFFRYDYHPGVGAPATHPPYHLHIGCWHRGESKFPGAPRFRVPEVWLEEVMELIIRDFLTPEGEIGL